MTHPKIPFPSRRLTLDGVDIGPATGLKGSGLPAVSPFHFLHSWGQWQKYEENGTVYVGLSDSRRAYTETRQARQCFVCGKVQDALLKDGAMPNIKSQT